jgi:hypothetical protein
MIDAANRVDDAAESFSRSASGINGGLGDAVGKLNAQANQTALLRQSAENSAKTAASSFAEYKRTERASVHVRDVEVARIESATSSTAGFGFFVGLENSGSTSTKHLVINLVCGKHETFGNPLSFSKAMKFRASIPAVIGPHSSLRLFSCEASNDYALSGPYIVFGTITYGDVFATEHVTEYCWEVVGLPSRENPSMQPCTYKGDAEHNCQDEDCKVD